MTYKRVETIVATIFVVFLVAWVTAATFVNSKGPGPHLAQAEHLESTTTTTETQILDAVSIVSSTTTTTPETTTTRSTTTRQPQGIVPVITTVGTTPTTTVATTQTTVSTTGTTTTTSRPEETTTTTTLPPETTTSTTTRPPVVIPAAPAITFGKVISWDHYSDYQSLETVLLEWTDNSDNEAGFRVYQDAVGCGFDSYLVTTLPPNTTNASLNNVRNYMWRGCLNDQLRVVSFNEAGESGPAGPYNGFGLLPPVPNNPVITSYLPASITWQSTEVDGFETRQFLLTDVNGNPLTPILIPVVTRLSATLTSSLSTLAPGLPSCVRIRGINAQFSQYDWNYSALSDIRCL